MMLLRLSPPRLLPLTILVMLLLLSVKAVTFGKDIGAALGLVPGVAPVAPLARTSDPVAAATAPVTVPGQPSNVTLSRAELALLQDLRKRRDQLDSREQALDARNGVIDAAEARLQSRMDHLAETQSRIDQLDAARKQRKDANWGGLVKVYETMKPRDAAAIFDVLDMHVLLEVLDRMNDRKAAGILAAMQPEHARLATQMLAQMRLRQDVVMRTENPENDSSAEKP